MSEANRMMGMHFFNAQDELRGGPDPALCAPGYTAMVNGTALDLKSHTAMSAGFYKGVPRSNHIVEDTVADDEKVAVRFVAQGTHNGEFMGMAADGQAHVDRGHGNPASRARQGYRATRGLRHRHDDEAAWRRLIRGSSHVR